MYANRAKMTTPTVGTGTLTLGTATLGYQSFAAAGVTNGEVISYVIADGTNWEIGKGVYSSVGPTLTRTLVQSSTGSLLNLTGLATVFQSPVASDFSGPEYWVALASDYTLTSTTATQKMFNATTNGALTLDPSVYEYRLLARFTAMSSTTGNLQLNILGAGTATLSATSLISTWGADVPGAQTSPLAQSGAVLVGTSSYAASVTIGVGVQLHLNASGFFRVTSSGTIIPSVALANNAPAVVVAGSNFFLKQRSNISTDAFYGAWT